MKKKFAVISLIILLVLLISPVLLTAVETWTATYYWLGAMLLGA